MTRLWKKPWGTQHADLWGEVRRAARLHERAVEVEPGNAQTWLLRAVALDQLGRADEAKQSLAQARAVDAAQVQGMAAARDDITSFLQRNP